MKGIDKEKADSEDVTRGNNWRTCSEGDRQGEGRQRRRHKGEQIGRHAVKGIDKEKEDSEDVTRGNGLKNTQ